MKMTSGGLSNWASLVVLQGAVHNHFMCSKLHILLMWNHFVVIKGCCRWAVLPDASAHQCNNV